MGKRGLLLTTAFMICSQLHAASTLPCISREKADVMEREQVIWNGRVAPMGTMCQEFLLKVYGGRTNQGMSATQVVCSMAFHPDEWAEAPLIRIARGEYRSLSSYMDSDSMSASHQDVG